MTDKVWRKGNAALKENPKKFFCNVTPCPSEWAFPFSASTSVIRHYEKDHLGEERKRPTHLCDFCDFEHEVSNLKSHAAIRQPVAISNGETVQKEWKCKCGRTWGLTKSSVPMNHAKKYCGARGDRPRDLHNRNWDLAKKMFIYSLTSNGPLQANQHKLNAEEQERQRASSSKQPSEHREHKTLRPWEESLSHGSSLLNRRQKQVYGFI